MFTYKTHDVCARGIDLEIQDGVITHCHFDGGCKGNTAGLAKMVIGRKAEEVAELLAGTPCKGKSSFPYELSKAILA